MKPTEPDLDVQGGRPRPPGPVVEFAGTPRAGKTTAMHGLAHQLEAKGRRVRMVQERAGRCPIPNRVHPDFNLWTALTTVADVLEARYADADVVLVDRGIFDALCWMEWYASKGLLPSEDQQAIGGLLRAPLVAGMIDVVMVMTVEPVEALRRDRAGQPSATPGPIVNSETLHTINRSIERMRKGHAEEFPLVPLVPVDTTTNSEEHTLGVIEDALLARYPELSGGGSDAPRPARRRP